MKLSYFFYNNIPDVKWELVRQIGIKYVIAKLNPMDTNMLPPWDFQSLRHSKDIFWKNGFELVGLEGDQFDMTRIKLGLPGRDTDIEKFNTMLLNMNKLNIKFLCYNFMYPGWYRSNINVKGRGGSIVTEFSNSFYQNELPTEYGVVTAEKMWDNYSYFIGKIMPYAKKYGIKLPLHPDDPPVSSLRKIGRIFGSFESIKEAMNLYKFENIHGITYCLGSFLEMEENINHSIEYFSKSNKINFFHLRNVEGGRNYFVEKFHDEGKASFPEIISLLYELDYDGFIRSDHVPTMAGESNDRPGYGIKGNLYGIGYIRGIIESITMLKKIN